MAGALDPLAEANDPAEAIGDEEPAPGARQGAPASYQLLVPRSMAANTGPTERSRAREISGEWRIDTTEAGRT